MTSLQHHKMIKFTEKVAGVISERNRNKFSKPETLKNLEQKLLQADSDDFDEMLESDNSLEASKASINGQEEAAGNASVKVFKLDLPIGETQRRLEADNQLHYSSEMISLDEFESRVGEEPKKFAQQVAELTKNNT